jgi:flagellar biosynthesis/type III secretory pathway protein FliH
MQGVIPRGSATASKPWRPAELQRGAEVLPFAPVGALADQESKPDAPLEVLSFPTVAELDALRRDGYQEGVQTGKLEVQNRLAGEVESIARALQQLPAELAALDAAHERFFTDVGRAIAVALEVLPPEGMAERIEKALSTLAQPEGLSMHLHPDDIAALREVAPDLMSREGLAVKESVEVQRGGFLIRGPFGGVDATLEARLRKLKKALQDA